MAANYSSVTYLEFTPEQLQAVRSLNLTHAPFEYSASRWKTSLQRRTEAGASSARGARVALCVAGLGEWISLPENLLGARVWLQGLRRELDLDVFMHLELYAHPLRSKRNDAPGRPVHQEQRSTVPAYSLAGVLEHFKPVKLAVHEEKPYCAQRDNPCRCTITSERWFEGNLKMHRCSKAIRKYEIEQRMRYDWILAMRPEYFGRDHDRHGRPHHTTPADIAAVIAHDAEPGYDTTVWAMAHMFRAPAFYTVDWFWMARRQAAFRLMDLVTASCEWHTCVLNGMVPVQRATMANERVLVEWGLRDGLRFARMVAVNASARERERATAAEREDARVVAAGRVNGTVDAACGAVASGPWDRDHAGA